jgi:predicted site-specific integrase-resolvase
MTGKDIWPRTGETARRLEVSPAMVTIYLREGRLKFIRTKAGILVDPESIEELRKRREARIRGVPA